MKSKDAEFLDSEFKDETEWNKCVQFIGICFVYNYKQLANCCCFYAEIYFLFIFDGL